jgi:RNA-directed DNA polymerase
MDKVRKLQRTLYRAAKQQPERRFSLLFDKVCRADILDEAWRRVAANNGSAGIDDTDIAAVRTYGETRFLAEIQASLLDNTYRASAVRRVRIPKPGQPGRTRPLGIPTVRDRVVQMAVKLVIEPMFESDFRPCSFGFRPKRTPRMALAAIVANVNAGFDQVVDVDLASYFDSIDHALLMRLVERRIGDVRVLRLIRAWLTADVLEDGVTTHPLRGTPQGGVISPVLSNIVLHEIDRLWCDTSGAAIRPARLVRYADDMVVMARTADDAATAWQTLQAELTRLEVSVNTEKSRVTTAADGFAFLGFEFRARRGRLYMWPRAKTIAHLAERVREVMHSIPSSRQLGDLIVALNPVLVGWCTYFRVGNSNRVFHKVDRGVRDQIALWLRRKHQITWDTARKRWSYRVLHNGKGLYRMVGKVTHLAGLSGAVRYRRRVNAAG